MGGCSEGGDVDVEGGDRPVVVNVQGTLHRQEDHLPCAPVFGVDRWRVVERGTVQKHARLEFLESAAAAPEATRLEFRAELPAATAAQALN